MDEYVALVAEFRRLTGSPELVNSRTGVCCSTAWRGMPLCCEQIVHQKGALQFTSVELELIAAAYGVEGEDRGGRFELWFADDGFKLVRIGRVWMSVATNSNKMAACLHTGWLSSTLESASHPTRPLLDTSGRVGAVMSVPDCVAEEHGLYLVSVGPQLKELWQQAVDLVGVKPYYERALAERLRAVG